MLDGKVVVVTGAASGIGREAAIRMAKAGARLLLADTDVEHGREIESLVRAEGAPATFVQTDISREDDVRRMVEAAIEVYGRLDGAFNNAAIAPAGILLHEMTSDVWQRNVSINLTGTFYCMKHEIRLMLERGGSIVNTSSASGTNAFPLAAEYCATKHGVLGLMRNAALDYGKRNIRVNAILPGAVRTPMLMKAVADDPAVEAYLRSIHPIGRYAEPGEIAEAAIWLLSDKSSFVTGAAIPIDGGYTVH